MESSPSTQPQQVTDVDQRLNILRDRHDSRTAGHFGERKTLDLVARDFWWEGMRADVKQYVRTCDICQRCKTPRHRPHGLLQPLPVPPRPWSSVSVDLIVKLPRSRNKNSIIVFVDRLTKMAHFAACNETVTARDIAMLFMQHVFRAHGLPDDNVSDRGPQFASQFWRALLEHLGIMRKHSSAYHRQTDGQTDRVNQVLEQYLRCYVNHQQSSWSDLLPLAEFAYNNAEHTATKMSPFFANYGMHPRADNLVAPAPPQLDVPAADNHVNDLAAVHAELRQHITTALADYERFANRKRQDHNFAVGQHVWLMRRHQATDRPSSKLDHRRLGPFEIVERINSVAFRLQLPDTMRVHDVFHVSLLEPFHRNTIVGCDQPEPLPPTIDEPDELSIEQLVDSRDTNGFREYLVAWRNYGADDWSWHRATDLPQSWRDAYHSASSSVGGEYDVRTACLGPSVLGPEHGAHDPAPESSGPLPASGPEPSPSDASVPLPGRLMPAGHAPTQGFPTIGFLPSGIPMAALRSGPNTAPPSDPARTRPSYPIRPFRATSPRRAI